MVNVLVVGSGGREHAIGWKLSQNDSVDRVFHAPGNGGTPNNIQIPVDNLDELAKFASENDCLTVVGPEAPLAMGIVDFFNEKGLAKLTFGLGKGKKKFDISVLKGPCLAKELARKIKSSTIIANKNINKAKNNGADCIIMDDGFQNPTLQKDFSIIVVNSEQGFGNKRVMPSGPLRESITRGISRTNLVITIGEIKESIKSKIPKHIPIIKGLFKINNEQKIFKGQKITAFAGIAYPEKFFQSLEEQGAKIVNEILKM